MAYTGNNNPDEPFKDSINLDYNLINGTEGVFFKDTLPALNETKDSQTAFQNDMVVTNFGTKKYSDREQIEEADREPGEFLESTEFIADKPILEYFNLNCSECCVNFKTFYEFKSHFKSVHQQKGKVKCCGKSFTKRCEVMEHISLHQNPEKFKYEFKMPHLPKLLNLYPACFFRCKTCKKTFAAECNLKRHMESHAFGELRPFKCKQCQSGFTSSNRLTKHIRILHSANEKKDFVCDICKKA